MSVVCAMRRVRTAATAPTSAVLILLSACWLLIGVGAWRRRASVYYRRAARPVRMEKPMPGLRSGILLADAVLRHSHCAFGPSRSRSRHGSLQQSTTGSLLPSTEALGLNRGAGAKAKPRGLDII